MDKDMQQWIKKLKRAGAECEWAGSGHVKVRCPDGHLVVLSSSPRHTERAIKNSVRDLKGHGLEMPGM